MHFCHSSVIFGAIAAALALLGAFSIPASAQVETEAPLDDSQLVVDPMSELRRHFRAVLNTTWWAEDPERIPDGYRVVVHYPDGWRGNPTGKAMSFCPERDARLWRVAEILEIQPEYDNRRWPPFECRK